MTGSTHIAVGVASSFAILQPKTVPECICAVTGGAIGGMICDIDSPGKRKSMDYRDDPFGWQIAVFVILGVVILLGLDYLAGEGSVEYIMTHIGLPLGIGAAVFTGLCIYGTTTIHRTFMHSILAGVLLSASLCFFCRPLATPFAIGFASHIIIDFFNKKKIQYLWPIPVRIGLNKFPSDGKFNSVLGALGTVISIYLGAYFFINSFADSVLLTKAFNFFSAPVSIMGIITVPMFVPYLIIINLVALVAYTIDYNLWIRGLGFYGGSDKEADEMSSFIMTLLLLVDIAGGVIGKLIVVFITQRGKLYKAEKLANFNLYVIPICILASWLAVLFTFFFPDLIAWVKPLSQLAIGGVPIRYIVFWYLVIINLITMFVFQRVQQFAKLITKREEASFALCFLGGASGGYLAMNSTGSHESAVLFSDTLPYMITAHAIVLTCIFFMK